MAIKSNGCRAFAGFDLALDGEAILELWVVRERSDATKKRSCGDNSDESSESFHLSRLFFVSVAAECRIWEGFNPDPETELRIACQRLNAICIPIWAAARWNGVEPQHGAFEARNIWSLFNAFTETLKQAKLNACKLHDSHFVDPLVPGPQRPSTRR